MEDKLNTLINKVDALCELITVDNKGLIEIQKRLIHERLGVPTNNLPVLSTDKTEKVDKSKIEISNFANDRIKVSGNTFNYKGIIKESGQARWEQGEKCWSLPKDSLENLVVKFEESGLVKGTDFVITCTEISEGFGNL